MNFVRVTIFMILSAELVSFATVSHQHDMYSKAGLPPIPVEGRDPYRLLRIDKPFNLTDNVLMPTLVVFGVIAIIMTIRWSGGLVEWIKQYKKRLYEYDRKSQSPEKPNGVQVVC